MSNVEHLFENAIVALELNRTKEQWLNANELNLDGVSNEIIEVIWDLAIYTKYTYEPSLNAIPVGWILNHPKFPHKNEDRKKCILDMIKDWEKENERV